MRSLVLMLQFFTRIPINKEIEIKEDTFGKGIVYLPLIGLLIGIINAGAYYLFSKLFPENLSLIVVALVNILITGALHLDGLADTCDGIFSSRKREKMLEIMKDSRIGTNGTVAIIFDLIFRIALLGYISKAHIISVIIITPIISRTMLSLMIYISSNKGKESGLGSLFIGKTSLIDTLISMILGGGLVYLAIGPSSAYIIASNIILILIYKKYMEAKLGVITGDILGASIELCELLTLFISVLLEGCHLL